MAQQYRHIVPANPERLICNHNLFDVRPLDLPPPAAGILCAILNSTLVARFKTFHGRYAGTEGNLKTEVVDVNLLEIPDPRRATKSVAQKLQRAFSQLCQRDTGPLVEEEFMQCHDPERAARLAQKPISLPWELRQADRRALDLAVFELLGATDAAEREALCDELYRETAAHFRQIRLVELQKQQQRKGKDYPDFRTDELAADLWDALLPEEKQPLAAWLAAQTGGGQSHVIPEGRASLPDANDLLDANTVFFREPGGGQAAVSALRLPSRSHAEILFALARLGLRGGIRLPDSEQAARDLQHQLNQRLAALTERAERLARSRTSDEKKVADVAELLRHWLIHGKPKPEPDRDRQPDVLSDSTLD
jgi:hypothetical protein